MKFLLKNEIILLLRFLGYIIVSLSTILSPILIYQLTHSLFYSGCLIAIEWSLKLVTYTNIGKIVQKLKIKKTYFLIDILRFIGFCFYWISYNNHSIISLFLASSLVQMSNAISNTFFESLISFLWLGEKRKLMQVYLLMIDLLAGVIFIPFISLFSINKMIYFVFFILGINFCIGILNKFFYLKNIKQSFHHEISFKRLLIYPKVLHLSLLSISITIPIAMINLQLPFFLAEFNKGFARSTIIIAIIKSLIGLTGMISIFLFKKWNNHQNIQWNLIFFIISILSVSWTSSIFIFLLFLLVANMCFFNFLIFLRNYRQNSFSDDDRIHLTGTFIAIDGIAYLLGAIITIFFSMKIKEALLFSVFFLIGITMYLKNKKEI
jgi:hypothetical protein